MHIEDEKDEDNFLIEIYCQKLNQKFDEKSD